MLSVVVASTDRDLTTTSSLKALVLGATATSTAQDGHLSNLIRRGSAWAETFVGQPLTVQTYRETVAGYGRRSIMLSRTPVRVVKAIYDATDTGSASAYESSEYVVDANSGIVSRSAGFKWTADHQWGGGGEWGGDAIPLSPEPMSGQESRPFLVDYIAGYTYGGILTTSLNYSTEGAQLIDASSTERTLPEDIEQGVIESAQSMFDNAPGVSSESLGDVSVSYRSGRSDLDRPGASWLAPYRRIV